MSVAYWIKTEQARRLSANVKARVSSITKEWRAVNFTTRGKNTSTAQADWRPRRSLESLVRESTLMRLRSWSLRLRGDGSSQKCTDSLGWYTECGQIFPPFVGLRVTHHCEHLHKHTQMCVLIIFSAFLIYQVHTEIIHIHETVDR